MLSYSHFTLEERKRLQELLFGGNSLRMIARSFGKSPSSVSREIKRNKSKKGYNHWRADNLATFRKRQKTLRAIPKGTEIWAYIIEKLNCAWSPEEIVNRRKRDNIPTNVGVSTIYRYIKAKQLPNIAPATHLRRRGKRYVPRASNYNTIHPDRIIPEWTSEIKERSRIGDWEGDTVFGAVGKGYAVTAVDRKSRFLCAGLLPRKFASATKDVIVKILKNHPISSISLDNGPEFAEFKQLEKELNTLVYFAEPHKPWQRGTNENTNDIVRFFFPKGCDFNAVSQQDFDKVIHLINTRPRKCLNWLSPFEVFFGVALT